VLQLLFPSLEITGTHHSPGVVREYGSLALTGTGYFSLAYMMLGQSLFTTLGLQEPALLVGQREARWPLAVFFFMANQVGAQLKSTGAYEVHLNGQLIHSKLATGAVPSTAALVAAIAEHTGLAPDPEAMARVGLRAH
jgi:selT/selW/selH-like putative selenoprotein